MVSPVAGVVVLAMFLAAGLATWFGILRPEVAPARRPLAPRATPGAVGAIPPSQGGGAVPADHPPLEMPEEVQRFLARLEGEADAKPDDAATWRNLAQVQYRAGQIDRSYLGRAEESFRHVLELDPRDPDALRGLGNIHFDRGEYESAVERYSAFLELRPEDVNVRTDRGTMLLYGGKLVEAIAEYKRVLERSPDFYQAHFNLGVAHAWTNDLEKARTALTEARRLAPDDPARAQIDRVLSRFDGTAGSGTLSFRDRVEGNLRRHEIVGPKVVEFEWTSDTEGRVWLDQFPMDQMPDFVRAKFLGRLERELGEARQAVGAEGVARLEIVDHSGNVMATITAE